MNYFVFGLNELIRFDKLVRFFFLKYVELLKIKYFESRCFLLRKYRRKINIIKYFLLIYR